MAARCFVQSLAFPFERTSLARRLWLDKEKFNVNGESHVIRQAKACSGKPRTSTLCRGVISSMVASATTAPRSHFNLFSVITTSDSRMMRPYFSHSGLDWASCHACLLPHGRQPWPGDTHQCNHQALERRTAMIYSLPIYIGWILRSDSNTNHASDAVWPSAATQG